LLKAPFDENKVFTICKKATYGNFAENVMSLKGSPLCLQISRRMPVITGVGHAQRTPVGLPCISLNSKMGEILRKNANARYIAGWP
jgi:hypothetical protein